MPKTHPPDAPEFRRQIVDLVRAGRDPVDLAREFEPTAQAIRNFVVQPDRQEGRREEKGDGLSTTEREERAQLRREDKQLRVERDILSRAAASFAREIGAVASDSSGSSARTRPSSRSLTWPGFSTCRKRATMPCGIVSRLPTPWRTQLC